MKIHQLSLFLENKPGQLSAPCQLLADAGINIVTMMLADTEQFGILRLVVSDWQKAKAVLEAEGCVVNIAEVIAVEVADRPGGLAELITVIDEAGVNVEYMYAFTFGRGDRAVIIFRFEQPDAAISALAARGMPMVAGSELLGRAGGA